jgi:hypothetical protein
MILVNSTEHAPTEMSDLEYLSYLATMPTFIGALIKQPVPSQYSAMPADYAKFLNAVQGATATMAKVINTGMTAKAPAGGTSAPTGTAPTDVPASASVAPAETDRIEPSAQPEVKDELVDEETFNKMKL